MELLQRLGAVFKRLRKLRLQLEDLQHDGDAAIPGDTIAAAEQTLQSLLVEARELETRSPARRLRGHMERFLPTLLHMSDLAHLSCFDELDGTLFVFI